jgi:glycosyltransferase involved in cell wall biosynthesis
MSSLHQFVPFLNLGAVATHLLEIQRTARDLGWESEVFAVEAQAPYLGRARHYTDYGGEVPSRPDDVLLYHLAIGSPLAAWLAARAETLVVDYHNVTPFEFFEGWHPDLVQDAARGRRQLRRLALRASFALADSAFNEQELRAAGYRDTAVVPILLDLQTLGGEADPVTLERLETDKRAGGTDWLFVGRVAPNKAQHDLVKALAAYRRAYDPDARLHLVGAPSPPSYAEAVAAFAERLGLAGAVRLTGPATPEQVNAHYRAADVFVCLSEHEGFCVPILEAWHHRVPVVAFAATAVPETLGAAGLLLDAKEPARVATAVHRVIADDRVRAALVEAGARRLPHYSLERARARLVETLERVNGRAGP